MQIFKDTLHEMWSLGFIRVIVEIWIGFSLFTVCVRLCLAFCKREDRKSINPEEQMKMKIKAVTMMTDLSPEEAAEKIADIYEEYLREEINNYENI